MSSKRWLKIFVGLFAAFLVLAGGLVVWLDPFYHYHAPLPGFYYVLGDQRYQNDGITRHFDYDAVITGTSMVENFRTSELDAMLGTTSVKVPYPGATFREIDENLEKGFATHQNICYVIRGLDMTHLVENAAAMRTDMGDYPEYLYDRNVLNDVKYLYNSSVFFNYLVPMLVRKAEGVPGGVSSFDDYSWSGDDTYSAEAALGDRGPFTRQAEQPSLTEAEKEELHENIEENVVRLAREHPETTFLYFFPPYSAAWYGSNLQEGTFNYFLEAEKLTAEQILTCPNIHLFLFSSNTEITTDMNLYKDEAHYSPAVSSWILRILAESIAEGAEGTSPYEITTENCQALFDAEEKIYLEMDYNALLLQRSE